MTRHFFGVLFWSFIGFVVFVNLFQFSGAVLPFEDTGYMALDTSNKYFGFSSLFNFVSNLSDNQGLQAGLTIIKSGFSVIKFFSIDKVVKVFTDLRDIDGSNWGALVLVLFTNLLDLLFTAFVAPFTFLYGLIVIIIGVFLFLWNLITIMLSFLLGYYSVDMPVSVILTITMA